MCCGCSLHVNLTAHTGHVHVAYAALQQGFQSSYTKTIAAGADVQIAKVSMLVS